MIKWLKSLFSEPNQEQIERDAREILRAFHTVSLGCLPSAYIIRSMGVPIMAPKVLESVRHDN